MSFAAFHERAHVTIAVFHERAHVTIALLHERAHVTIAILHERAHVTIAALRERAHVTIVVLHERAHVTIAALHERAHVRSAMLRQRAHVGKDSERLSSERAANARAFHAVAKSRSMRRSCAAGLRPFDGKRHLMTIDAHQHFWDPRTAHYPWMTAEIAPIVRPFGPADLRPHVAAAGVDRTILVQTRANIDETRAFLACATVTDFVAGVVGWVDLTSADVARDLAELRADEGGRYLVGIRHQVHDEPDPDWLVRGDVLRGLAAVRDAGLTFDLLVRTRELPAAIAVAAALPDLRFVLDHCAKPPIAGGSISADWSDGISRLASAANVSCKLSGLVTEADWASWTIDDLRPFVTHVAERFGSERLIFGSDWPVCLLAAPYERVIETARTLAAELPVSREQHSAIFGANAVRAYRLDA